jgi:hypothetical protein
MSGTLELKIEFDRFNPVTHVVDLLPSVTVGELITDLREEFERELRRYYADDDLDSYCLRRAKGFRPLIADETFLAQGIEHGAALAFAPRPRGDVRLRLDGTKWQSLDRRDLGNQADAFLEESWASGRLLPIRTCAAVIGREDSDVRYKSFPHVQFRRGDSAFSGVSRDHALVFFHDGLYYVMALDDNQVFINSAHHRLAANRAYPIEHGDEIYLGSEQAMLLFHRP